MEQKNIPFRHRGLGFPMRHTYGSPAKNNTSIIILLSCAMRNCLLIVLLLTSTLAQAQNKAGSRRDLAIDARHLVSFTPICGIVAYDNFNPGFGFEYEYILSQEAGIGLRLPFAFGYAGPDQDLNYYGSGVSYKHTSLYAAPGIRFHAPFRNKSVEFATGPALILGNMHFSPYEYYGGSSTVLPSSFDYNMMGIMADNSLNFYRNKFMFGFDVRVGSLVEVHDGSRFFIHFGMHFGGKF